MSYAGKRSTLVLGALGAAWLTAIGAGMAVLMVYDQTPGAPASPPGTWPAASPLARVAGVPTLVLFAHPQCPCSRASVRALAGLMASVTGRLIAHVLVLKPSQFEPAWAETDIWRTAAAIPGVTVAVDEDGVEARRFGAVTSGQAMLYDGRGALQFSGGLTAARGQEGGGAGRETIAALLADGAVEHRDSPVFGCSLLDLPQEAAAAGSRP